MGRVVLHPFESASKCLRLKTLLVSGLVMIVAGILMAILSRAVDATLLWVFLGLGWGAMTVSAARRAKRLIAKCPRRLIFGPSEICAEWEDKTTCIKFEEITSVELSRERLNLVPGEGFVETLTVLAKDGRRLEIPLLFPEALDLLDILTDAGVFTFPERWLFLIALPVFGGRREKIAAVLLSILFPLLLLLLLAPWVAQRNKAHFVKVFDNGFEIEFFSGRREFVSATEISDVRFDPSRWRPTLLISLADGRKIVISPTAFICKTAVMGLMLWRLQRGKKI